MNIQNILKKTVILFSIAALTGCSSFTDKEGNYTTPIGTGLVTSNNTIYTPALQCMGNSLWAGGTRPDTISVGRILDYTGKDDLDTGKRITQGAALMAISALGKARIPQVERFDTAVTEFELRMKDNKLVANSIDGDKRPYQPILAGSLPGSKYTLIGGITELNYNIRSVDGEALIDYVSGGMRTYVMNVAMDIRLVETESLRIVSTRSYQKQIIGREIQAGVFRFFDSKLVDIGIGERSLEPMQLAVRAIVELGVYDMLNDIYRVPHASCDAMLSGNDRNLVANATPPAPPAAQYAPVSTGMAPPAPVMPSTPAPSTLAQPAPVVPVTPAPTTLNPSQHVQSLSKSPRPVYDLAPGTADSTAEPKPEVVLVPRSNFGNTNDANAQLPPSRYDPNSNRYIRR